MIAAFAPAVALGFLSALMLVLLLVFIEGEAAVLVSGLLVFIAGLGSFVLGVQGLVIVFTKKYVLTDKRVMLRSGVVGRRSHELLLTKIESIYVEQDLLGRLFGYGKVILHGTGGVGVPMLGIENPRRFQGLIQAQIEARSAV